MISKKDFYEKKESEYPNVDYESIFRYRRAIKLANLKTDECVLDIGCKYAILKELLLQNNILVDYYGVDISNKVFNKIKDYNPKKFLVSDVSKTLPFENNKFDYVFALEIMEHVESPSNMLSEIYRVLKKNGVLILSVPNVYCWNELLANLLNKKDTEGHISSFTHQNMERLLKFAGLKIKDYMGTYLRVPFSKKFLRTKYFLVKSNNLFLCRSFIYKAEKA